MFTETHSAHTDNSVSDRKACTGSIDYLVHIVGHCTDFHMTALGVALDAIQTRNLWGYTSFRSMYCNQF
jgi:hypothetical protein